MARIFNWLIFSKRHKGVRSGVIFLFSNLLAIAGLIFTLEVALIFLGMSDLFLPLTRAAQSFLNGLVF
jgi:hypothetical protein